MIGVLLVLVGVALASTPFVLLAETDDDWYPGPWHWWTVFMLLTYCVGVSLAIIGVSVLTG